MKKLHILIITNQIVQKSKDEEIKIVEFTYKNYFYL